MAAGGTALLLPRLRRVHRQKLQMADTTGVLELREMHRYYAPSDG
jgi:hypothetical protein